MTAVLGIDPSLQRTAVALLAQKRSKAEAWVEHRESKGHNGDSLADRCDRQDGMVAWLVWWLGRLAETGQDSLVVIEGPSYASTGGHQWDRAGMWWRIVYACVNLGLGLPLVVTPAQRMTYATGKGQAAKEAVYAAAMRRYEPLLGVTLANNDQADAVVLAAIGARLMGFPVEPSLPQTHLAALVKLDRRDLGLPENSQPQVEG